MFSMVSWAKSGEHLSFFGVMKVGDPHSLAPCGESTPMRTRWLSSFLKVKMYPSYCIGPNVFRFCARHDVYVEFPMWVNSKSAVKGIIKILKHIKQVVLLRFAKVGKLFDNIVHVQLFILGIQVGRGKAVWIVPVSAKGLFLLAVYFKGFDHSEIGSHMGNSRLNHSMVPEH